MRSGAMQWWSDGAMTGENQRPSFMLIAPSLHYSIAPSVLDASHRSITPLLHHGSACPIATC